ncbi:MAG: Papain family cysteine protease [Pelotomaculum sp. PtaB.Bin104]|nr:MAG: Papain family cysteine protease [Pelotomaculum sp. PtaB.Bin104]
MFQGSKISLLKLSTFSLIFLMLMSFAVFCIVTPGNAQASSDFEMAPLNPDFIKYFQDSNKGNLGGIQLNGHSLGKIPSPLDLSHLKGKAITSQLSFPSIYDLRTMGKLTKVQNQNPCGACWTFSALGSLESCLLPSESWDFSENNLKNTNGFDKGACGGGVTNMAVAFLARWSGPIAEKDDPYNPYSSSSPSGLSPKKHIQQVYYMPSRGGPLDNNNIKQAIMDYGAVSTSLYMDEVTKYNPSYYAYYYDGAESIGNHVVDIVGWDDNFNKNKFNSIPPGNGAFIAKNSWGTSWGENGYFYISYYDKVIGNEKSENAVFLNAEDPTNYSNIYQYDPYGWVSGYKHNWGANIFTASSNESLAAVSTYAASPNTTYEIYIYKDVNVNSGPTTGTLAGSKTGTITLPGYNTVKLDTPVPLTSGQKFSVIIKLNTPGYDYPIPVEYPLTNYCSKATSKMGESWLSTNGSDWVDLYSVQDYDNVCLKAFTIKNTDTTPPAYQSTTIDSTNKIVTLTFSENLVANVTNLKGAVTFSSNGTTFAALGASDTVAISGNTLVVTFNTALTGSSNKIRVAANSLKDGAGNVLATQVTTEPISANIIDPPPAYQSAAINGMNKIVTLTFSENLVANVTNLKGAVTFSSNGTTFAALGASDTVAISGKTLVVTFNTALIGSSNKIRVAANSLKDAAGNVLTTAVTTATLDTPPLYQSAAINGTNKIVTLTFSENLVANVTNLKGAVTFSSNGTTFAALGASDTVAISGNTLVVTFNTALTGSSNKIRVAANSLKDGAGHVLSTQVTTEPINANIVDPPPAY